MIKLFLVSIFFLSIVLAHEEIREEIWAKAYIKLTKEDIRFLARIDSGARITSLHAVNIELDGENELIIIKKFSIHTGMPFHKKEKNEHYIRNIGRLISFDTQNELGQVRHMTARVVNVVKVRNVQGVEYRYVVRLGLKYKNVSKYKDVNLRDRSNMTYKLLIGRNWLNDDFVIKTDKVIIH
ncbi:MAG: hypothetical protein COA44_13450 [Arcobacter sp.]|nr:MAG: hypothetical protein COA44_13450 [Arcobacter sp.]